MSNSPPSGHGAGKQDARAIHVDHAQGALAGDYGMQSNIFAQVIPGGGALVAGRDIHVQDLHVHDAGTAAAWFRPAAGEVPRQFPAGPVIVGDIPGRPSAFQLREALLAPLYDSTPQPGACRIHAVTGMSGAGKTQAAAEYARRRVADGWRLVAWVHAAAQASTLDGLSQAAVSLGICAPGHDQAASGRALRHWLEADGERCLLVFDDANDPDQVRPYLPSAGRAHVILTSTRQAIAGLGCPVSTGVFTQPEALAYLAERTGIPASESACELAEELGRLPLALAQAAAVIRGQRLSYQEYLGRLRTFRLEQYLIRPAEDPYLDDTALAILLSLIAVLENDESGLSVPIMAMVAMLSPAGVPRDLLQAVEAAGLFSPAGKSPASAKGASIPPAIDFALARLADMSVLSFSDDGAMLSSHGLITRVVREVIAYNGTLADATSWLISALGAAADAAEPAWRHPKAARNLIEQITELARHVGSSFSDRDRHIAESMLALRDWAFRCACQLGDERSRTVSLGESVVADCERLLGRDQHETLVGRANLAVAYREVGRLAEAISLGEDAAAELERALGRDHRSTLAAWSGLAWTYRRACRLDDASRLIERILDDCERVFGDSERLALSSRANLAGFYKEEGKLASAVALLERSLADSERLFGHSDPLGGLCVSPLEKVESDRRPEGIQEGFEWSPVVSEKYPPGLQLGNCSLDRRSV